MKNKKIVKIVKKEVLKPVGADFFGRLWEESWTYIKTVVDVVREPVLILDKEFRVMAANEPFYKMFKVTKKDTEGKIVYELGNGQWDIPALKKLLEDVLPNKSFFKGFEVSHEFPVIGRKIFFLNAREIRSSQVVRKGTGQDAFPPIILLAMEDVTKMMVVAETFANHANDMDAKFAERTKKLEAIVAKLQKEVDTLVKNKRS